MVWAASLQAKDHKRSTMEFLPGATIRDIRLLRNSQTNSLLALAEVFIYTAVGESQGFIAGLAAVLGQALATGMLRTKSSPLALRLF
jgi:hypothetical protein